MRKIAIYKHIQQNGVKRKYMFNEYTHENYPFSMTKRPEKSSSNAEQTYVHLRHGILHYNHWIAER